MSIMGQKMEQSNIAIRPSVCGKRSVSILDLLHWAFVRECAQLDFDELASTSGGARVGVDTIWRMAQAKALGCRPDGGGRSEPHPDADIVASAVASLPESRGGLKMGIHIAELTRSGRRPEWRAAAQPSCRPVEWKNGKHGPHAKTERAGIVRYPYRGVILEAELRVCPVHYVGTASEVAAARRNYLQWWSALHELRQTFQIYGNLSCWMVTDQMPDMQPWKKAA